MFRLTRRTIAGALLLLGGALPAHAEPAFIRGMALGSYSDMRPKRFEQMLKEVKALNVSHVSIVVPWSTPDVRSLTIAPRKGSTTPDAVLLRMIRRARSKGLQVFLFPILDVQRRKPLEWRGTLKPPDWDRWWAAYTRFILHYARLAQKGGAQMLCVGSELVTTEKMRDRWVGLIKRVRRTYRGKLVYSANWDHYEPVTFWDRVDVVGLTGYYQLSKDKDAPESTMRASWVKVRHKLTRWARKKSLRFVFTEVGYPSMDGCAVHPWDYTVAAPPDLEEQRRAFSAFVNAWHGTAELAGVFFWDWYGPGGPTDTRYTPRGKPAARVIADWYKRLSAVTAKLP